MNDYSPGWAPQDTELASHVAKERYESCKLEKRRKQKEISRQKLLEEARRAELEKQRKRHDAAMRELRAAFKVSKLLKTIHFHTF